MVTKRLIEPLVDRVQSAIAQLVKSEGDRETRILELTKWLREKLEALPMEDVATQRELLSRVRMLEGYAEGAAPEIVSRDLQEVLEQLGYVFEIAPSGDPPDLLALLEAEITTAIGDHIVKHEGIYVIPVDAVRAAINRVKDQIHIPKR